MSAPTEPTRTTPDLPLRSHSVDDLERVMVKFLEQLFQDAYRLDNPGVNAMQKPGAEFTDTPGEVPYDYSERAQTLTGKVPPQIVRGRIPRTLAGEIELDKLPDYPSISVQVIAADVDSDCTHVTLRLFFHAYDENPDSQGYQDCLNMMETASIALTSWGQKGIDHAYPIVMPIKWKLLELGTWPHFIGEMTTEWQLPSARPLPDFGETLIPEEHIEVMGTYDRTAPVADLMGATP